VTVTKTKRKIRNLRIYLLHSMMISIYLGPQLIVW